MDGRRWWIGTTQGRPGGTPDDREEQGKTREDVANDRRARRHEGARGGRIEGPAPRGPRGQRLQTRTGRDESQPTDAKQRKVARSLRARLERVRLPLHPLRCLCARPVPQTSQIASCMASPAGRVAASNDGTLLALARSPDVGTCPSCLSHGQRRRTHHRQPHASRCEPSSPYPNGPSHVDSRESLRRLLDEPKIQIPLSLFWPPNRFPVVSSYDHITPAPPVPARLSPPLHP